MGISYMIYFKETSYPMHGKDIFRTSQVCCVVPKKWIPPSPAPPLLAPLSSAIAIAVMNFDTVSQKGEAKCHGTDGSTTRRRSCAFVRVVKM